MANENLNTRTGRLSKLGMERANTATENGYDIYTIASVLEVPTDYIAEFLSR